MSNRSEWYNFIFQWYRYSGIPKKLLIIVFYGTSNNPKKSGRSAEPSDPNMQSPCRSMKEIENINVRTTRDCLPVLNSSLFEKFSNSFSKFKMMEACITILKVKQDQFSVVRHSEKSWNEVSSGKVFFCRSLYARAKHFFRASNSMPTCVNWSILATLYKNRFLIAPVKPRVTSKLLHKSPFIKQLWRDPGLSSNC